VADSLFSTVEPAPADPILGLTEAFRGDDNPNKVNLTVGVYQDETGTTPVLNCVRKAEERLAQAGNSKGYLSIDGDPGFGQRVRKLLFGDDHQHVSSGAAVTLQTPGGTGALRVAGEFLRKIGGSKIYMSKPTWANHRSVFTAAGLDVGEYSYLDGGNRWLNFPAMIEDLENLAAGSVILLHACCHNPSGSDPNGEQWEQVAETLSTRGIIPLVDFAYQGFGDGLNEDAAGLRTLAARCPEMLVCSSYSKNFGLYCERVGALTLVANDTTAAKHSLSQAKLCVRANYSNPPRHGAAIVSTILQDEELTSQWECELATMRNRIRSMREKLIAGLAESCPSQDFTHISSQRGMFSFSGLNAMQVDELREKYSIYIVRSGRINVAGLNDNNIGTLCKAVGEVAG